MKMTTYNNDHKEKSLQAIFNYYGTQNSQNTNIAASFEDSWMSRVYKSYVGVCFIVENEAVSWYDSVCYNF